MSVRTIASGLPSLTRVLGATLALCVITACGGTVHGDGTARAGAGGGSTSGDPNGGAGTAGAMTGTGGTGGVVREIVPQASSEKLDVLFVVDNSVSMAGKQKILADSIPSFVLRLSNPPCVDAQGKPALPQPTGPAQACVSGTREFAPIADAHFGVITTSLGAHGGTVCASASSGHPDDQAQLLPSKRMGVPSYLGSGYLAYDSTGTAGVADASAVATDLRATILAAGEDGCGYEAPLEAMYRFLVDPEPPLSVEMIAQQSTPTGLNEVLLQQRKAFLRPDSALAIVIVSDENDCSIVDSGIGWLVGSAQASAGGSSARMPRATSACDVNPNDVCCRSCANIGTESGCGALSDDPVCKQVPSGQQYATWDALHDSLNLRCFDQQRRFGVDLLYPIERYTNGLTNPRITNRAGVLVNNPLFAARDGKGPRSPTLISLSLIVGAPWQDLATAASSSAGHDLEYLDGAGLDANQRWPLLIGDVAQNVAPSDPFMIESIAPRVGQNPLIDIMIADASSTNPQANPINGHEQNVPDLADLQYACIFQLPTPLSCQPGGACDCSADSLGNSSAVVAANSPLCQPPGGGVARTTQYYGKGYPGTRELRLAQALGERAVAGSVCPKDLSSDQSADFAYEPVLNALVRRVAKTLE